MIPYNIEAWASASVERYKRSSRNDFSEAAGFTLIEAECYFLTKSYFEIIFKTNKTYIQPIGIFASGFR